MTQPSSNNRSSLENCPNNKRLDNLCFALMGMIKSELQRYKGQFSSLPQLFNEGAFNNLQQQIYSSQDGISFKQVLEALQYPDSEKLFNKMLENANNHAKVN